MKKNSTLSINHGWIIRLDCSPSPIFSWDRLDIARLTVTATSWFSNVPRGRASGIIALVGGVGGGEKNRGTVITSLQLAFTERVVPATQAFDWSLDNRCLFALTTILTSRWQVDISIKCTLSYHKAHLAQTHEGFLVFWLEKCFLVCVCRFYFEEWA